MTHFNCEGGVLEMTTKIFCDSCELDITHSNDLVDYRLVLSNESKTPTTAVPWLNSIKHFCTPMCLKKWVNNDA